jgi:D-alanyl-D-alanine-carboxypeptidase/D-alanyl-D-alanine-endopeptidase
MGLGWLLNSANGKEIAIHDGGTGGFRSFIGFDPKARIGVVVLSNGTRSGVEDIGLHLLNPKLPLANPEPPKQHTEIPIDPKLLDNYTGRYQVTPNLIFEITRDGDRLYAQGFAQGNGQSMVLPKFELFAEREKNFFAKVADNQIAFETGPDGRATSIIMHRAGREMPAAARLS